MDMEIYTYADLQIYILVMTFMCYEQSFCRTEKPIRSLAMQDLLYKVKLISFHLTSLWHQSCCTAFTDEDLQTSHTMACIS